MKMIDKDALVAEIERRIKVLQNHPKENHKTICHLDSLKQSLDTFEVKEVDLDAEVEDYIENTSFITYDLEDCDIKMTAKHFFELGLKAQKGE